jgi:GT2 family glycosyltransferase
MKWVERCFDSLSKSIIKSDVFVVDNGSTDGTMSYIRDHYPEVMYHQSKENLGFGKANNIGLQFALYEKYDYVYLLNQDAWVMPDTFQKLIHISKQYPEYGILSPFQMNADLIHIDRDFISDVMNWKSNPDITNDLYNQHLKEIYPVTEVMAAHWFITRKCLNKVGGFSPSFPHYSEDYNYTDRVHFWGMNIGIVPSIRVVHDRGWREVTEKKMIYLEYSNSIRELSNPNETKRKSFFKIICKELISMLFFKSLLPLNYLWKLIYQKKIIERNRLVSMTESCAFLKKDL